MRILTEVVVPLCESGELIVQLFQMQTILEREIRALLSSIHPLHQLVIQELK